ncbi:hypothetical protein [Longimicrobium sp.]|uniref:hypothetical protein n=1 Tax=Longimicrobium sp. TaxID=2029185 RepID=UPI002E3451E2|nr:hypothetical protein [Longimicrobium sp.]HEX6042019.1 hypothetical protein [Longimicrobium sp.]
MPGNPLTGQGGQFGGPRYGWGDVPGAGGQNANSGLNRGRYTNSPEAGLHRGEWQWRGHGPSAQQSYGWDYQGGVGRDEITQRTEARMGPSFQARMAQERGGGLPRGRYAIDYDQGRRTGGGSQDVNYDWGWQGHGGGSGRSGGMDRYGSDYRGGMQGGGMSRYGSDFHDGGYGASGRHTLGSGGRQGGGYGQDFGASAGGRGFGGRQLGGGSYGSGHARAYDRGLGGTGRGGYSQPLSDAEFYRRVERW